MFLHFVYFVFHWFTVFLDTIPEIWAGLHQMVIWNFFKFSTENFLNSVSVPQQCSGHHHWISMMCWTDSLNRMFTKFSWVTIYSIVILNYISFFQISRFFDLLPWWEATVTLVRVGIWSTGLIIWWVFVCTTVRMYLRCVWYWRWDVMHTVPGIIFFLSYRVLFFHRFGN